MFVFRTSSSLVLLLCLHVLAVFSVRLNLFGKSQEVVAQEGALRLVGGKRSSEGRVEVYHEGEWGTVCDDNWDLKEAQVACRQLGYLGAVSAEVAGKYGEGTGKIWLDDLNCQGTESSLSRCAFKGWAITDCSHKEDAGVVCETGEEPGGDREYSLDHSLGLSEELGALFDSGEGCDFHIIITGPGQNADVKEQKICVHRLILSLYPQLKITNSSSFTVESSEACHPHVSSFIRYLYSRKIDVTLSSAQCFHQLAYVFGVRQLLEEVGRVFTLLLPEDSTFSTQVSLYEYSVRTGDLVLQENCLQYLAWNYEALIDSAAGNEMSLQLMEALLERSDLVVRDEGYLLQSLESWILARDSTISLEEQNSLLRHIRFPMIPADNLYDLQFTSKLYESQEAFYRDGMLQGFQFNALSFSKLRKHVDNGTEEFLPRVYTADPWSVTLNTTTRNWNPGYGHYDYRYNYGITQSFTTPAFNTMIFKSRTISWYAQVFLNKYECSQHGFICDSVPAARLYPQSSVSQYSSSIRFSNRLLLRCGDNKVFHVQDFKNNVAVVPTNDSMAMTNPCPDAYSFRFVVRPEYI
ncbi:galectin-3-binding protein A [Chanos chanos]|uniref:Galectin-3-binding protein A n=1 Tax=Chanos chanos TaxID=29144 RepID=A0A6J2WMJ1_CHACN|nr:galectin-3-binding protein [Chanos chanos]